MRTSRSLAVFRRLLLGGGVCLVPGRGVPGPGGCVWSWGVYLVPGGVSGPGGGVVWGGCVCVPGPRGGELGRGGIWSRGGGAWSGTPPLWTEWMTDRCKNITLAKTSFRPVIIGWRTPSEVGIYHWEQFNLLPPNAPDRSEQTGLKTPAQDFYEAMGSKFAAVDGIPGSATGLLCFFLFHLLHISTKYGFISSFYLTRKCNTYDKMFTFSITSLVLDTEYLFVYIATPKEKHIISVTHEWHQDSLLFINCLNV